MNSEQKHKVSRSSKMQFHISGFGLIKERDKSPMRRVMLSYFFLFVLTVLLLCSSSSWAVIYISNITDLQKIGNDAGYPLNGEYELTQDIDASDTINWNSGAGFVPIGTESNPFTGYINGKGYKIIGLYINRSSTSFIGLFGYAGTDSEVKNLGIEDCQITGYDDVGGLMGYNEGTVSGCYNAGSVSGNLSVGGLLGQNHGTVSGCYNTGSATGNESVGGLAGGNGGTVSGCYNTGSVSGNFSVGGLLGNNIGTVSGCYSMGAVWGNSYVGGFIGFNFYGTVSNSYAMGSVTGSDYCIGGLIGQLYRGSITNTYSTGAVGGSGSDKGGLIGYRGGSGTITSSYWDTQTSGQSSSDGGTGKTTAEMKQLATFVGWDFTNVWGIAEYASYPYLLWQGGPFPIQIDSIEELQLIGNDPGYPLSMKYELSQDIDASDTVNWNSGAGFNPIGTSGSRFTGKFDGKGHKVTGLYINRLSTECIGLFGYIGSGGEVKDLGIENCYIAGRSYVGGLVGVTEGIVTRCYSTGTVPVGYEVGGLIGVNGGVVSGCYSTCSVSGNEEVGGFVGYNIGLVESCYSVGSVSGSTFVGGLAGNNFDTINFCYSTGLVSGNIFVGGLVGTNSNWVSDSYWDVQTSGQSSSDGGEGKTTAEMKQQATYSGWDFVNVWGIIEGANYPYLRWQGGPLFVFVPEVSGLTQADAESTITGAGLTVGTVIEQCSDTVSAGSVISQDPLGGEQVSIGTTVELTVSSGPCPVTVPDVVGMTQVDAESTITGAGLTVGTVIEQCNDAIPAGSVISQDPLGGQQVSIGTTVELTVSSGPCPVTVPDIVGMSQAEAESAIAGAGLTVGMVTEQCSDTVPAGSVISQDPAGGQQVPPGTAVNLVVSTGPCPEGEGTVEGTPEGTPEGTVEGTPEGSIEGEGVVEGEGTLEGEGIVEGTPEGTTEGEGIVEGTPEGEGTAEGIPEGIVEGTIEGEGIPEGTVEGTPDGEGTPEGEGVVEGEGLSEGEGSAEGEKPPHSADPNGDGVVSLSELLRVIQFFNTGGYHCETGSEDGYAPGIEGDQTCSPHASDYNEQDWIISLSELLRLIQFFNYGGYHPCPDGEDGYCPGP